MSNIGFKKEQFELLDNKWSKYRDNVKHYSKSVYESLMKETWPLLYKAWKENDDVVDKEVARLICTLGNLFSSCFDDDGNCIGPEYIEVLSCFHSCLLDALVYYDSLSIDDEGNIVFPGWFEDWIVNPETFELPNSIPGDDY